MAYLNSIYAIKASDGSLAWRYPEKPETSVTYYAPPAVTGDQIIAGSYASTVSSINIPTGSQYGTERWRYKDNKGRDIGGALVINDLILVPSSDYNLYALDMQGGLRWKFKANHGLWACPTSDGELAYVPSMDHYLYAVSLKDGGLVWKVDLGAAAVAGVELNEGVLYLGTLGKQVLAVNAKDGQVVWKVATDGMVWNQPVYHDGAIFIGDMNGSLYALDVKTGAQKWKLNAGGPVIATAALLPEGVVFVDENGGVKMINFNGEIVWTRSINGKLYTSPVVAGERVVLGVTGGDHLLVALDLRGNDLWSFDLPK